MQVFQQLCHKDPFVTFVSTKYCNGRASAHKLYREAIYLVEVLHNIIPQLTGPVNVLLFLTIVLTHLY